MHTSSCPTASRLAGGRDAERKSVYAFRLTPAEWRQVLADESFLDHPDNGINPRRLMGVPVEIIPDPRLCAWR